MPVTWASYSQRVQESPSKARCQTLRVDESDGGPRHVFVFSSDSVRRPSAPQPAAPSPWLVSHHYAPNRSFTPIHRPLRGGAGLFGSVRMVAGDLPGCLAMGAHDGGSGAKVGEEAGHRRRSRAMVRKRRASLPHGPVPTRGWRRSPGSNVMQPARLRDARSRTNGDGPPRGATSRQRNPRA